MSTISKVSAGDIRKIIFDNFNDTDVRFSNDDILGYLNQIDKYGKMNLDVLDFEQQLLDMETSGLLRPIAQNFNTRYYKLWNELEQTSCKSCRNPLYFSKEEERNSCSNCGATL